MSFTQHLFGEFAVAIYHTQLQSLVLAQDCLGIVPLYYSVQGLGILFSSSIDNVSRGLRAENLDEEYIADYLCYGDHYGERTPFRSIGRLTPGISIEFRDGMLKRHRGWALDRITPVVYPDLRDYADELQHLVIAGVRAALPPKGTVLCEVSGGLDSSTVACTAARCCPSTRLHAMSYVYSESQSSDESLWSKRVIEKYGLTWHRLDVDSARPFTELPSHRFGQPYHAIVNGALHRTYTRILDHNKVDVVLTGVGGDGVLFGDGPEPFFLADMFRRGHFVEAWNILSEWTTESLYPRPLLYWWNRCVVAASLRRIQNLLIQDHPPKISWISKDYDLAKERNGKPRKSWVPARVSVAKSWFLERVMRSAAGLALRDYTNTMRADFRHPLMYLPLVKFMCGIPWELMFSPTQDRLLQRQAFAAILPPEVTLRTTKGGPDHAIYCGLESGEWGKAIRAGTQLAARGYIDQERWSAAVDLAKLGRCESIKHFKAAATLEVWLANLERADRNVKCR
jgi:asparagine synthase (glutamine-hydrolysing)